MKSKFIITAMLFLMTNQPWAATPQKQKPAKQLGTQPAVDVVNASPNIIRTKAGGTETTFISNRFPNRISTPFAQPRVIDTSGINLITDGSSVFVSAKGEEPFVIYITGSSPNDQIISLTLIPKAIPSQTIQLLIDSSSQATTKAAKVESYTQQLIDLLRTAALGKSPEGFSEAAMPATMGIQQSLGLSITPITRYSGSTMDIYKYKVETSKDSIEITETDFYQKGVRAVAIFPNSLVRAGEPTNVFVLADKSLLDGEAR